MSMQHHYLIIILFNIVVQCWCSYSLYGNAPVALIFQINCESNKCSSVVVMKERVLFPLFTVDKKFWLLVFQEVDVDDEFQEEDVDDEFQEEDVVDEYQKNDTGDNFQEDDDDEVQKDRLE
ncbi:hypothetical protein QL285_087310 [Trifolium repens]|nr:hypothetical protein QL285_087310 [Trifolium repens]